MSYTIKTNYLPAGHRLRPSGYYEKDTITVHSTGNLSSTPQGERNWLNNTTNKRLAAWHDCVGDGIVIRAIPHTEPAWHCGNDYGNKHSIGIEIVESGDRCKVLMTAAEYIADMLRERGWGIDRLKRHYDWTGKNCPRILIDKAYIKGNMDWNWFVKTVEAFLGGDEVIEKSKIIVDGKEIEVERILKNGFNFIKIRDVAEICGYDIGNKDSIPVLTKKQ